MSRNDIVKKILEEKVVAVVRIKEQSQVAPTLETLVAEGISALEITSNTPGYQEEIAQARKKFSEADVVIGAGTIVNPRLAEEAIAAGAQFLVTPNTNVEVIAVAHENDIPILVGALTPTEVSQANEHGADIIKLFPANALGTDYFKALKGPFDDTCFFVVGGIGPDHMKDWLAAGASGFGLGSELTKPSGKSESTAEVAKRVKAIIQEWNESVDH